jgi:CubicO group peptidase (beta-lactamase class C family)
VPVTADRLFQAASISKSLTAMALLHWLHKGSFRLMHRSKES